MYKWMRDEAPVYHSEKWGFWALSRFEDVRAAALDPETYLQLRGHRHRRHRQGSEPARLPAKHRQSASRPDPQARAAAFAAGPHRQAEDEIRESAQADRAWRHKRSGRHSPRSWPGRCPTRCSSTCSGCRGRGRPGLEQGSHELKDRGPDDARLTPVAKAATAGIQSYFVELLRSAAATRARTW